MFEWNHLPHAGGIYDQDPMIMESFRIINIEKAKVEKEKDRKERLNQKTPRVKNG